MGGGQPPASDAGTDGAEYGGDGGANVGADGQRQAVLVGDLAAGQCRKGEDQGGVTRLHHHRGQHPY